MSVVSLSRKKAKAPVQTEPSREANSNGSVFNREQLQQEVQSLEAELAKAEAAVGKISEWEHDRLNKASAKVAEIRARVDIASLRAMPLPPASVSSLKFQERSIALATVRSTGNHREITDEAETLRLARTMTTVGLQQRIGVRDAGDGTFELIFGARRCAAARLNAWEEIPAKIYAASTTAAEVEILRTIENFGRKDLTHVERAIAVARTIDAIETTLQPLYREFKARNLIVTEKPGPGGVLEELLQVRMGDPETLYGHNPDLLAAAYLARDIGNTDGLHAYVGQQLGFHAKWVKDNAYVSQLGGKARELLAAHRIDVGHARELAKLGDKSRADHIAGMCARKENGTGGQTVEWCRQQVIESLRSLKIVPWQLDVAFGKGITGCTGYPCSTCPYNSKSDPDLFGGMMADEPAAGVCTNGLCFDVKQKISEKDISKFVEKARVEVKKRDVAVTETNLASLVPLHIKPSSAVRKAKKAIEPGESKAKSNSNGRHVEERRQTPEQIAQEKLQQALRKWKDTASDSIKKAARKDPMRLVMLYVLQHVEEIHWPWEDEKKVEHWKSLHPIVEAALPSDIAAITALATTATQYKQDNISALDSWKALPEFFQCIADAWGIKTSPMPQLEDFLPKPKPPTVPKPSAKQKRDAGDDAAPTKDEPAEQLGVKWDEVEKAFVAGKLADADGSKAVAATPLKLNDREWVCLGTVSMGNSGNKTARIFPLYIPLDFTAKFGAKYTVRHGRSAFRAGEPDVERQEAYTGVALKVAKKEMVIGPHNESRVLLFKAAAREPAAKASRMSFADTDDDDGRRRCRVCGCTDDDCRGCIAKTGAPCSWIEADLCSACMAPGHPNAHGILNVADIGHEPGSLEAACHAHLLVTAGYQEQRKPPELREVIEHAGEEYVVTLAPVGAGEDVYALRKLHGKRNYPEDRGDAFANRQVLWDGKIREIGPVSEMILVSDTADAAAGVS